MSFNFYQNVPVYENYKGFSDKLSYNRPTSILRDTLPLDMLTPQIRHYELRQKNSRYANFSDLSTPSYAIFQFFQKNSRYANFSDLSTPSYAIFDQSKNSRYANFSAVFTPNYAIVSCVKKFRYHFSSYSIRGNYFFFAFGNQEVTVHKPKSHST